VGERDREREGEGEGEGEGDAEGQREREGGGEGGGQAAGCPRHHVDTAPTKHTKSNHDALVTVGSSSSSSSSLRSSLELSDTQVYGPAVRALLETASHFCEVAVLSRYKIGGMQLGAQKSAGC